MAVNLLTVLQRWRRRRHRFLKRGLNQTVTFNKFIKKKKTKPHHSKNLSEKSKFDEVISFHLFHERHILFGNLFPFDLQRRHVGNNPEKHTRSLCSQTRVCECTLADAASRSYLMPRSLARLSWRSVMLCRISSTSCRSSLSSIRDREKSGSRKDGGSAAAMDLDRNPEVT